MLDKRQIIIFGSVFGVILIAMAIIGIMQQSDNDASNRTTYTDSVSGEQIKEGGTSNQGTDISLKNTIIYPGFSQLINRGLSPEQIQSIQSTISEYSIKNDKGFKIISLDTASVRHVLPQGASKTHTITFDIVANRKDAYYVTVDYDNTDSCITKLYAADKTTLLIER